MVSEIKNIILPARDLKRKGDYDSAKDILYEAIKNAKESGKKTSVMYYEDLLKRIEKTQFKIHLKRQIIEYERLRRQGNLADAISVLEGVLKTLINIQDLTWRKKGIQKRIDAIKIELEELYQLNTQSKTKTADFQLSELINAERRLKAEIYEKNHRISELSKEILHCRNVLDKREREIESYKDFDIGSLLSTINHVFIGNHLKVDSYLIQLRKMETAQLHLPLSQQNQQLISTLRKTYSTITKLKAAFP